MVSLLFYICLTQLKRHIDYSLKFSISSEYILVCNFYFCQRITY
nr:MAG TPA: hypothetical protein [Caudoviricetes sp.]